MARKKNSGWVQSMVTYTEPENFNRKVVHLKKNDETDMIHVSFLNPINEDLNNLLLDKEITLTATELTQLSVHFLDNYYRDYLEWAMRNNPVSKRTLWTVLFSGLRTTVTVTESDFDDAQAQYEDWYNRRNPPEDEEKQIDNQ